VPWETLATFAVVLVVLSLLSDWIGRHVQGIGLLLTERNTGAMVLAWLIFLPGIALHEASHWAAARVLGLRPSRLRVWPESRGRSVRMGYVDFRSGGTVRDSLVGMAPFITGCAILLGIALQVFGLAGVDGWRAAVRNLWQGMGKPDIWLYVYLIFTVSNGMMPSASDREAWGSLFLYLIIAVGGLYALDLLPSLSQEAMSAIARGVQTLTYALSLAVLIDLPIAIAVGLTELFLGILKGQRVVY